MREVLDDIGGILGAGRTVGVLFLCRVEEAHVVAVCLRFSTRRHQIDKLQVQIPRGEGDRSCRFSVSALNHIQSFLHVVTPPNSPGSVLCHDLQNLVSSGF